MGLGKCHFNSLHTLSVPATSVCVDAYLVIFFVLESGSRRPQPVLLREEQRHHPQQAEHHPGCRPRYLTVTTDQSCRCAGVKLWPRTPSRFSASLYRPRRSEPDDVGEYVALRPAAHSVVRPSLKPSDASMKSPASSIIKLSMKPKPTMGSADMSASCPPSGAARRAPPGRRPMRATPARDSPRWLAPRRATPAARQGSPR